MDDILASKIQKLLNEELIRRLLKKYFEAKGLSENMDKPVFPPTMQDLVKNIPQLLGKVEVVPSVEDIDPNGGAVRIEWNMFVLGTNRMYLGESSHKNLAELQQQEIGPSESKNVTFRKATPNKIIEFVTRILSKSKAGKIDSQPRQAVPTRSQQTAKSTHDGSQGFEQNRPVN